MRLQAAHTHTPSMKEQRNERAKGRHSNYESLMINVIARKARGERERTRKVGRE